MEFNYHFNNLFTVPRICDKFAIFQVGELFANKETVVMNHYQFCYEITFVISENGESVTDRVKTEYDDLLISAVMTEILVTILRQHSQSGQNYVSPKITSKSLLVYHVSFYIENNILKLTNLNSLTEVFHYTYQYITRVFYEITGVKLHNFFLNEKIKTAKPFLESSDYTVTEISALLNYSCTHAFTRMFKEQTGKTPKQYQKEFKSQPRFSEEDI